MSASLGWDTFEPAQGLEVGRRQLPARGRAREVLDEDGTSRDGLTEGAPSVARLAHQEDGVDRPRRLGDRQLGLEQVVPLDRPQEGDRPPLVMLTRVGPMVPAPAIPPLEPLKFDDPAAPVKPLAADAAAGGDLKDDIFGDYLKLDTEVRAAALPAPEPPALPTALATAATPTPVETPSSAATVPAGAKKEPAQGGEGSASPEDSLKLDIIKGSKAFVPATIPEAAQDRITGGRGYEFVDLTDEIPVAGLAKRFEEVYVPGESEPIVIPRGEESLYLLQRVRDEAHRFAVTYHRKLRDRSMVDSILDDVPGIGAGRKKALVRRFGSVKKMREASIDDLAEVVPDTVAHDLYDALHEV